MARVVVIGAGMGGLAAAARLRVKGHEVTVVEAATTYGGMLGTLRRDGFAFDTGPNVLTLPAVYRDLFLKTGAPLEDSVELLPLDPGCHHRFADGTNLTMPGAGAGRAATAMGETFDGRAADEWRDLMHRAGLMWTATRRQLLEPAGSGVSGLPARDRDAARTLAPRRTLRGLARTTLSDERARQVLERYATSSGSDPRRAPAVLATLPYVEATFGAWHVAGGLRSLADALHDRARERGVVVRLGTPATRIEVAGGRVSAVAVGGGADGALEGAEVLPADVVVADVAASIVNGRLLAAPTPSPPSRLLARRHASATPSCSQFVLLLALRGRTPGLAHHTVWHPRRSDDELDAVFGRAARPAADPTIHVCAPDDPAMSPSDGEAWSVRVAAPRHSPGGRHAPDGRRGSGGGRGAVDWDEPGLAQAYADQLLARLAERGVDLSGRVIWRELRTPADLERSTGAPGGATHGTPWTGPVGALRRPQNASPVPGLFLVGASTHPGGGLPLVGMSAEIVAELVGRA